MRLGLTAVTSIVIATTLSWEGSVANQSDPRLDGLFALLLEADHPVEAARIEVAIWALWLESGDEAIDRRMHRGIGAMNAGDYDAALAVFDTVADTAPDFAEGWNKRATLYWLMSDYDASVDDIARTLALEPRHFGALSGLALIREAQGRPFEALEALDRVQKVHPHLPHLQQRIDHLTSQLGEAI